MSDFEIYTSHLRHKAKQQSLNSFEQSFLDAAQRIAELEKEIKKGCFVQDPDKEVQSCCVVMRENLRLKAELAKYKKAVEKTLTDNANLADGDDCTLIELVKLKDPDQKEGEE